MNPSVRAARSHIACAMEAIARVYFSDSHDEPRGGPTIRVALRLLSYALRDLPASEHIEPQATPARTTTIAPPLLQRTAALDSDSSFAPTRVSPPTFADTLVEERLTAA